MQTLSVQIGDKKAELPQNWNDLSLQQQLECYNILTAGAGRIFSPAEVLPAKRIALVARLLKLDDNDMHTWRQDCRNAEGNDEDGDLVFFAELSALLSTTDFLFDLKEEDGNTLFQVKLGLTKCPWPTLRYNTQKGKRKTYHAPADGLANFTLYELALTFSIFERYLQSNDEADANELIATIYRPSKPQTQHNRQSGYEGDRRLPIYKHESMVPKRQARIASLPKETKQLILFWFASCRQSIIDSFPNIFDAPKEMEIAGERMGNDYGWGGMLLALAGGIVHLAQVNQEPYENGLIYLSYLEDQRKAAEMRQTFKS